MIIKFFISIFVSALISFLITPLIRNFFIARSWVESPELKQKKTHNATAISPVPRGGGLPVYFSILITSLIFLPLNRYLIGILMASLLTLIIGVWDDLKDISPKLRLLTNVLSALIVVASGIGVAYISNPFGGIINFSQGNLWIIADLLAVIWITWCMNITGWAAGVEGQLPGFVSISAVFIGILGLRFSQDTTQWPVIILAGAVAGSYLGFLPFNFFPQSIMPGYSGKSLAGFFLAVLSILSGAKLATLLLLLGVPMIDAVFVIFRRLKNHRPLLLSDNQHLHHQLLKSNWTRPQIAVFYWSISLVLGFISLFLNSQQKMYVFVGLFFVFIGFLLKISRRI
jgi:UDP-GlcNAc:undecaprenyl-phosphate GlcNAc-1-phosphate transferase